MLKPKLQFDDEVALQEAEAAVSRRDQIPKDMPHAMRMLYLSTIYYEPADRIRALEDMMKDANAVECVSAYRFLDRTVSRLRNKIGSALNQ